MTLGGPWKPTRPRETANGRGFPQPLGKRFAFPTAPTAHDHSAHHRHATLNTCVPSAILPAPRPRWPLFNRSCLAGFQRPVTALGFVDVGGPYTLTQEIIITGTPRIGANTSFDGALTAAVPEPGTMLLVGSGLAALWARRRRT